MKSVIRVCNIYTTEDITNIKIAVSCNNGVIACEINKDKREVSVVYDKFILSLDELIESIENKGYTVI